MKGGSIHVAVGRIRLDLPGCMNLKQKRKVVRPLIQRLRDRFGVSAAEVGHHDVWHSSLIAVAAVGCEASELDSLLQDVMRFIGRNTDAVVVDVGVEVLGVGEIHPLDPVNGNAEDAGAMSIERQWLDEEEG